MEKKNAHQGHRERFKNKAILDGIENWPSHEIMELLLMYAIPFKDVNGLAHDLIDQFGSISGVFDAGFDQLKTVSGIGDNAALFLSLMPDLFEKYLASQNLDSITLKNATDCVNYFRSTHLVRSYEQCFVFCLNSKKKLVKVPKFKSLFSTYISVSKFGFVNKVMSPDVRSVVLIHTHPNADAEPTAADVETTKDLVSMLNSLGIKVEDHIIITQTSYFSFFNSDRFKHMFSGQGLK